MTVGRQVEFRVLGPLEVVADGRPLPLGGAKQRAVLAMLLHAGRVVPSDRLIEAVWPDRLPGGVQVTLRSSLSRLRSVLEAQWPRDAAFGVLVTRHPRLPAAHRP